MHFSDLVKQISTTDLFFKGFAKKTIDKFVTQRNWLVGFYIVEFEQKGEEKAQYGETLIAALADQLEGIKGFDERNLRRYRTLYRTYPFFIDEIRQTLSPELISVEKRQMVKYALGGMDNQLFVSQYQTTLPGQSQLEAFLRKQKSKLE